MDLMKFSKAELIEIVEEKVREIRDLTKTNEKIETLAAKHAEEVRIANQGFDKKINDIKQAILTAAAMKHPDSDIRFKNSYGYDPMTNLKVNPEPEEALLLRHLFQLCDA